MSAGGTKGVGGPILLLGDDNREVRSAGSGGKQDLCPTRHPASREVSAIQAYGVFAARDAAEAHRIPGLWSCQLAVCINDLCILAVDGELWLICTIFRAHGEYRGNFIGVNEA